MAIERAQILDEALKLLNDVGIDGFTTRKLADRLGVQQPALYWHFSSKSALLDALNGLVLDRFHAHRVPTPGESWDHFAVAHARSFRKALLSVRNGGRLNAGTRPTVEQFAEAERELELYVAAGFTLRQAFSIAIAIARYVTGFVVEEQDERERTDSPSEADFIDPLAELTPFPLLSQAVRPMIATGTMNTDDVFEAGLTFMIDGIRAKLDKGS